MPELTILSSDGKVFSHKIEKDILNVGRAKDSDILLSEQKVSRKHAQLSKTLEGYLLKDLGSQNGTFVNGTRISQFLLRHNDRLKIGSSIITFLDDVSGPATILETPKTIIDELKDQKEEQIIESGPGSHKDSDQELLLSLRKGEYIKGEASEREAEAREKDGLPIHLLDLEKSNKILYVLYQISRKLNTVPDFDELLSTIMDSIFQVIDADHGFVALLGDDPDELIPKVVKYRTLSNTDSQALRFSRTIINKVINEKVSVLTSNAMEDDRFEGAKSVFMQNIRSVMSVPLWRKNEVIGIIQVDSFRLSNKFSKADLELLTTISNQMAMVIEQANLNEKIRREGMVRNRLERFHSPEVVDLILSGIGDESEIENLMAPKEKQVTILFTDIVNFTPLSERLSPTEVSVLLNQYYREMTDIIFHYFGTLDKFIGDAIMAVFGAPIERENDAESAIKAALEMRRALFEMMKNRESDRRFDMRLGINTGRVVAGNLGSPKRMDYTVIGDTVNTASRLESIADPNQILIGENTYEIVKDKFNIKKIGQKKVKGKRQAINVYEVLD